MHGRIVRLIAICALATAGCLGGPTHTVTGLIDILDATGAGIVVTGTTCTGIGPYAGFGPGTPVSIEDGSDSVAGVLSPGEARSSTDCRFSFSVVGVPDAPLYNLMMGPSGALGFTPPESESELAADNWLISLSLGSNDPIVIPLDWPRT